MTTANEQKKKQDGEAVIIVATVAVIVVAIFAFNVHQMGESKRFDDRMCRTDQPLAGVTAILIDKSDPVGESEVAALQKRIRKISDHLKRNEMLAIYILDNDNADDLAESFCLCNPGQGSSANAFTQNPVFIQQKYDTSFGAPLAKSLSVLTLTQSTSTSPLIEAIRAVTEIEEFRKAPKNRTIVVISDMLQNTPQYSQHSNGITFADFSKSEYGKRMLPDLKGVTIDVEYVSQKKYRKLQTPEHRQFWKDFFKSAGASSVELHVVSGTGLTAVSGGPDASLLPSVPVVPLRSAGPTPFGPRAVLAGRPAPSRPGNAASAVESASDPATDPPEASNATETAPPLAGSWNGEFDGNRFQAALDAPALEGDAWRVKGNGSMDLGGTTYRFELNGSVRMDSRRVNLNTSNGFELVGSLDSGGPAMSGRAWKARQPGVSPRSWTLARN